ncbi:hypothetical protein CL652_02835 [bacterium]|nr:hypothetical protein [bacterium]|tara:strand:- start:3503 stop:4282 length:780 start_codon:yes stop_codon:yes gene_type:complete
MNEQTCKSVNLPTVRQLHFWAPFILQGVAWPFGRFALDFFTRLKISGRENLTTAIRNSKERGVGVVFALNHTSELDILFPLVAISPLSPLFPMFYVTHGRSRYQKETAFGWRRHIYGLPAFLVSWGAHQYIAGQNDYSKALSYHERILKMGKSVCIFPEGKIRKGASGERAHGGVGYLSEATGAIVVPVAVSGASGMSVGDFLKRRRRLRISYGTPLTHHDIVDTSLPIPERYQTAAKEIMKTIDQMRAGHLRSEEVFL